MPRYIDADALIHEYYKNPTYLNLCMAINNAQTADVVERKKGKWETEIRTIRGHKIPFPVCSVCGKHAFVEYIYCPNCGAEMRE